MPSCCGQRFLIAILVACLFVAPVATLCRRTVEPVDYQQHTSNHCCLPLYCLPWCAQARGPVYGWTPVNLARQGSAGGARYMRSIDAKLVRLFNA